MQSAMDKGKKMPTSDSAENAELLDGIYKSTPPSCCWLPNPSGSCCWLPNPRRLLLLAALPQRLLLLAALPQRLLLLSA